MNAISTYSVDGNKISISTPFCDEIVETCRKWGGTFDKPAGCWVLPVSRLAAVQSLLGVDFSDLVEVEIGRDKFDGYAQIHVGWHVLAGRRGRDYRADIYADLVDGEIPKSGGSVKSPAVSPSSDAKFRLWVPRDFAIARELQIVNDPMPAAASSADSIDRDALIAERDSLAARLAEIDAILAAEVVTAD